MRASRLQVSGLILATTAYFGCGVADPAEAFESAESLDSSQSALVGNILIQGRVADSSGNGLAGVTVTLSGSAWKTQVTGANGSYSFSGLAAGSYSVRPSKGGCSFAPDVVNLNNLKSSVTQNFVGGGSACAAGITRKYLTLIYNPILESEGGARLITARGYNDPDAMTTAYVADMRTASHAQANYVAAGRLEVDEYPVKEDGFQYTDETFLACLNDAPAACHKPGQEEGFGYAIDYPAMLRRHRICERFNAGEFDELWLFGAPFMGFWEANQAGTQAISTNGPVVTDSSCLGRLNIMGFSYERGIAEMLEDFGHRSEGTLYTLLPNSGALFSEFSRFDRDFPGGAQCGTVHIPPNGAIDYDWSNPRAVTSGCDDWLNYPNRTGARTTMTCSPWNCDARQHKIWWMSHFPHVAGTGPDGGSNNWWTYLLSTGR